MTGAHGAWHAGERSLQGRTGVAERMAEVGARVIRDHMIRNAILPVVTVAGMQAGALVGGSVVVETVFAWPGLGRLVFEALSQRDYPVLLGLFLVMSVLVILINMLTDLLARLIDPRIAASARAA